MIPTFVRTRQIYRSYADFWKLVEVSGFPTCYVDQMNLHDPSACYIMTYMNDEWLNRTGVAHVIHWNMEFFPETESHAFRHGIKERWSCDKAHADSEGIAYVPIGSDYRLCNGDYVTEHMAYDVAFMGCMSERRVRIYNVLCRQHIRVAPNLNGFEGRQYVLAQTRMVVHVHQTERKAISPLRLAVAAAHGLPVLCETCDDPGIHADVCPFADYDALVEGVQLGLARNDLRFFARLLQQKLCERHTFEKCVMAGINQVELMV